MKKYLFLIKNTIINKLDYSQELATNILASILIFAGMAIFWHAVFQNREIVKGFTFEEIIKYYVLLNIVYDIIVSKFAFRLIEDVVSGHVSNLLLKPVRVKSWLIYRELGEIIPLIIIKLVVFSGFYQLFIADFSIDLENLLLACLIIPFSYLINANLYFILGCFAFWLGQVKGLLYGIRRIFLFLSGGYIPLAFFPGELQNIIAYLPFKYVFSFPIQVINEGINIDQDWDKLVLLVLWATLLSVFAQIFFVKSYKSNESVGI